MVAIKRIVTAGGTLACALGIGFIMQSGRGEQTAPVQAVAVPQVTQVDQVDDSEVAAADRLELSDITDTAAVTPPTAPDAVSVLPESPVVKVALDVPALPELPAEETITENGCDIQLSATTTAAAMVSLSLSAPCLANERVTLHHNGMMITQTTDERGQLETALPALSENALFIAAFSDGSGASVQTSVESLSFYDRVVVQWKGQSGLSLHALEYDAGLDDRGHVTAANSPSMDVAARGEGGFIAQFGDTDAPDALVAQVYTFPTGTAARKGDVRLIVEAEVTATNCNHEVSAQSIQVTGGKLVKEHKLALYMPECDAIGDFLVLKNLLNDLKVAGN